MGCYQGKLKQVTKKQTSSLKPSVRIPVKRGGIDIQSILDLSTNSIYLIGAMFDDTCLGIYHLQSQQYQRKVGIVSMQDYSSINVAPVNHCVSPIYDTINTTQVSHIISLGGYGNSDHFCVLKRYINEERTEFKWDGSEHRLAPNYPQFNSGTRAININNNIHIIGNLQFQSHLKRTKYWVYQWANKRFIPFPDPPKNVGFHGLVRNGNRIVIFGGWYNGGPSKRILSIDLSNEEMKGNIDPNMGTEQRWQICKHKMPFEMESFGYASIGDSGLVLIVSNISNPIKTMNAIYLFDTNALFNENKPCFYLSKMRLPMPLKLVNCVYTRNQLHIIGGSRLKGSPTNTHFIVEISQLFDFLQTTQLEAIINYWKRKECINIYIPSVLIDMFSKYSRFTVLD